MSSVGRGSPASRPRARSSEAASAPRPVAGSAGPRPADRERVRTATPRRAGAVRARRRPPVAVRNGRCADKRRSHLRANSPMREPSRLYARGRLGREVQEVEEPELGAVAGRAPGARVNRRTVLSDSCERTRKSSRGRPSSRPARTARAGASTPGPRISSARSWWGQTPRRRESRRKAGGRDQLARHVGADVADDAPAPARTGARRRRRGSSSALTRGERDHCLEERGRLLAVDEVTGVGDRHEADHRVHRCHPLGVLDREERRLGPAHDERRAAQRFDVRPEPGIKRLAAGRRPADAALDVAAPGQPSRRRASPTRRRGPIPARRAEADPRAPLRVSARVEDDWRVLQRGGAGVAGRAAVHQHAPPHPLRVLRRVDARGHGTERVADEVEALEPELLDELVEVVRDRLLDAVAVLRVPVALAAAAQSRGRDHAAADCAKGGAISRQSAARGRRRGAAAPPVAPSSPHRR